MSTRNDKLYDEVELLHDGKFVKVENLERK